MYRRTLFKTDIKNVMNEKNFELITNLTWAHPTGPPEEVLHGLPRTVSISETSVGVTRGL